MDTIKEEINRKGITRLCHFTPSRNLSHIANNKKGILATKKLKEDEREVFNPTDIKRYDNHEDFICCSIQYPNVWYFDKAKDKETLFKDWVILFISTKYLLLPDTKFCHRN